MKLKTDNFFEDFVKHNMENFFNNFQKKLEDSEASQVFTISNDKDKEITKKTNIEDLYTETIRTSYSKAYSNICHLSKNLYNLANWLTRMRYFFLLRPSRGLPLDNLYTNIWNAEMKKNYDFSIFEVLAKFKKKTDDYINKINQFIGKQGYHSLDQEEIMERFWIDKEKVESFFKKRKDLSDYYKVGVLMSYDELWRLVKYSPEYLAFRGQKGQQTLKYLMDEWKGYFRIKKNWNANPKKCPRPSIPGFKKKNGEAVVIFPNQSIYKIDEITSKRKNGKKSKQLTEIGFSPKRLNLPSFKTTIPFELIHLVRIVPKGNCYDINVVYEKNKQFNAQLDKSRIASADFGGINLLSIANNIGDHPRIVKGGAVKSINHIAEYQVSQLVSDRDNLINELIQLKKKDYKLYKIEIEMLEQKIDVLNKKIAPVWIKRHNRVKNIIHQTSRKCVDYCVKNRIGTIVLGYNDGWKQSMKMRKKERKWFYTIPFYELYKAIQYKAEFVGIDVIKVKEFIEDESGKRKGSSQTCCSCGKKGNRVHRGLLYCPHCNLKINADVNGAFNHLKWGKKNALTNYKKRLFERPPVPLIKLRAQA